MRGSWCALVSTVRRLNISFGRARQDRSRTNSVCGSSIPGSRLVISCTFSTFLLSSSLTNWGVPRGAPRRMIPGSLTRSSPRCSGSSGIDERSAGHQTVVLGRPGAGTVAEVESTSPRGGPSLMRMSTTFLSWSRVPTWSPSSRNHASTSRSGTSSSMVSITGCRLAEKSRPARGSPWWNPRSLEMVESPYWRWEGAP